MKNMVQLQLPMWLRRLIPEVKIWNFKVNWNIMPRKILHASRRLLTNWLVSGRFGKSKSKEQGLDMLSGTLVGEVRERAEEPDIEMFRRQSWISLRVIFK